MASNSTDFPDPFAPVTITGPCNGLGNSKVVAGRKDLKLTRVAVEITSPDCIAAAGCM